MAKDSQRIADDVFSPFVSEEVDKILRALQESLASELAARMVAMKSATDNAVELKNTLSIAHNRERQAKITGEILEIVAGVEALQ
ncbi:ATPase, F1 complex, gamma subunit protein [Actinidia rufa]|uniref:F-ATPase gamma subunit n=1 Tax=Actinidia rufa TaxID=165716 RepID=A0A7J0G9D1_9ERIC|nr:ATPase, F1 complex, gamma subunit protein [Actinidia rufa]